MNGNTPPAPEITEAGESQLPSSLRNRPLLLTGLGTVPCVEVVKGLVRPSTYCLGAAWRALDGLPGRDSGKEDTAAVSLTENRVLSLVCSRTSWPVGALRRRLPP